MSTEIWVAVITSICSLVGVIITVIYGNKKQAKETRSYKDLTTYKIEQLEKKQDKHNTLIERMYKVEDSNKSAHHRMDDLIIRVEHLEEIHLRKGDK